MAKAKARYTFACSRTLCVNIVQSQIELVLITHFNVQALKKELMVHALQLKTAMVANRGRNNPTKGSFSFFEEVRGAGIGEGEVFFGHFT